MNSLPTIILLVFNKDNLGPVTLYEELVQEGNPCKFVYYLNDDQANRLALRKFISSMNTILLGFSFASNSAGMVFDLAKYLSCEFPGTPRIFGGVHPTIEPLSCLDYCNAVCVGEGDGAILEIVEKIKSGEDYLKSHNLVYKKDGQVVRNILNPLYPDLDKLPIRRPYTTDHVVINAGSVVPISAKKYFEFFPDRERDYMQIFSRGCPYACSYCCNSTFCKIYPNWPKVRSKSVDAIIIEVCENIKLNPKIIRVNIADDCFLVHNIDWLRDFVKQWRQKVNKPVCFYSIPEYINQEKLEVLNNLDICYIDLGLQSGSKKTNEFYNRGFSKEVFLQACQLIRSLDIDLCVDVIFDNPWENEADYLETLDILTKIKKPFFIQQFSLKIYPGTKLYEEFSIRNLQIPETNSSFKDLVFLQDTDINRILILAQILPRKVILFLFKNRNNAGIKAFVKLLHLINSVFFFPLLAMLVVGPRDFRQKVVLAFCLRKIGLLWLKDHLGIGKKR